MLQNDLREDTITVYIEAGGSESADRRARIRIRYVEHEPATVIYSLTGAAASAAHGRQTHEKDAKR